MVDFVESRLYVAVYVQLCCRFWQHIGNNVNSTACRGRLCCQCAHIFYYRQISGNVYCHIALQNTVRVYTEAKLQNENVGVAMKVQVAKHTF